MEPKQFSKILSSTLQVYSRINLDAKASIYKQAGVLVPLFYKDNTLHILLTKRTQKVEHHKGEISFPGGAKESQDNSLLDTALRESQEEMGILSSNVQILGVLDDVFTLASGFVVTPYVGIIPYPYHFQCNHQEIEEILEIPFSFFFLEKNYWEGSFYYQNQRIPGYFFQWREDILIWGITGYIIKNLCRILKNIGNLLV